MAPSAISRRIRTACGRKRVHIASMQNTPAARAASTTATASSAFMVNAFSTSTCLPAAMAASAFCACIGCGVAT
jgi:hypothetical protein